MVEVFNGYELLLFKRFQSHPREWKEWREKIKEREDQDVDSFGDIIPHELWYLSVTLHQRPKFLQRLAREEIEGETQQLFRRTESLLTRYVNMNHFTEFHLDSIFKYGEDNILPKEIFRCENMRYLSLKYNCLYEIPADIGRLRNLQYLALTHNRLHVQSIPFTLTFCTSLKTLLLDNNLLDALPGFLLQMSNIETVHRHGNHNYFKSTFMWYHTDVYYRIISLCGNSDYTPPKMPSLAFFAAKTMIGCKKNFFYDDDIAPVLKDYICDLYEQFNICQNCATACLINHAGFKVITFKNPYLGNTCVPFQHWVCSLQCAQALEIPARLEQIAKAKELDSRYEHYVSECQRTFSTAEHNAGLLSCLSTPERFDEISYCETVIDDTCSVASSGPSLNFMLARHQRKKCVIM